MSSFFQGRMLYPQSVWGRRHPRAGRPHPFLYAGAGNRRTFAHKYFGTQPTGYGLRGGDPRFGGVSGAPRRVYQHMLAGAMQRQVPGWARTRRRTHWGRQAQSTMAQQKRDYKANKREFRQTHRETMANLRRQFKDAETRSIWEHGAKQEQAKRDVMRLKGLMSTNQSEFRRRSRERFADYKKQRRATATQRPMYAAVRRHPWYGYSNWRPTQSWWRRRRYG